MQVDERVIKGSKNEFESDAVFECRLAGRRYSTVTDFAKLRGWSTSRPLAMAMW